MRGAEVLGRGARLRRDVVLVTPVIFQVWADGRL